MHEYKRQKFSDVKAKRIELSSDPQYKGNLTQGTKLPFFSTSPYSFYDTLKYLQGLARGDSASTEECKASAPIGKLSSNHSVGLISGTLKTSKDEFKESKEHKSMDKIKILFVGDMMVSNSGEPLLLDDSFLAEIKNADAIVINIESPVTFSILNEKRKGLNFKMSQSYLAELVKQIKSQNPDIKIVYDIANNHALDNNDHDFLTMSSTEKALYLADRDNFPLLRTIASIRQVDSNALIIGAHFSEDEFANIRIPDFYGREKKHEATINVQTNPVVTIEKGDVKVGLLGFTDVLNHNAYYRHCRVFRTEDIPTDLEEFKQEYKLDYLYLVGHGNVEQSIYPKQRWRAKVVDLLEKGADGFIGHGPHVPQTNEVITIGGQEKLIVHSVGNFFGPTKLKNTALNSLTTIEFEGTASTHFTMQPIEAYLENNRPIVTMTRPDKTRYPKLLSRYKNLYPLGSFLEVQLLVEKLTELATAIESQQLLLRRECKDFTKDIQVLAEKRVALGLIKKISIAALDLVKAPPVHSSDVRIKNFISLAKKADQQTVGKPATWKKITVAILFITSAVLAIIYAPPVIAITAIAVGGSYLAAKQCKTQPSFFKKSCHFAKKIITGKHQSTPIRFKLTF